LAGRAETSNLRRHAALIAAAGALALATWACGGNGPPATNAPSTNTPGTPGPAANAGPPLTADAADCGTIVGSVDPGTIAVVRARGTVRMTQKDVCGAITVRAGDRLDAARIASDIRALWGTGDFDDVMVQREDSGSGAVLTFFVRERPVLEHVQIDGATAIPANTLRAAIALHEGEPVDVADLVAARDKIVTAYVDKGYRSVKVEYRLDPASPMAQDVEYRVEEGPLAVISTLTFTGLSLTTDKELRALIPTRGGAINAPGGVYASDEAERAVLLVQAHLYDRGLVESNVAAPALTLSPDGKSLAIAIAVREGSVFRIGKVRFAGDLAADPATYAKLFPLRGGDVFNRSVVVQGLDRIRAMHDKLGKPAKDVEPETDLDPGKKTVDLTIKIAM
jgi:outer membrane protein insertion porin family